MKDIICPYCGAKAEIRQSDLVYGDRNYGLIYVCSNYPICDAYVGIHKGTKDKPKGTLANAELRYWRMRAHNAFDRLWKSGQYRRKQAYQLAADMMGKDVKKTHIGMFTVKECQDLISALRLLPDNRTGQLF